MTFFHVYVLITFVNTATITADRPSPPDPNPDRSLANAPPGIAPFLILLRWIIGYGQELALALRGGTIGDDFARVVRRYRTRDLAVILARLQRGLMLAAGLQDRLTRRAATGRDLMPVPYRDPTPGTRRQGNPQRPRAPRRTNVVDLPLDRLPTAEEIASELRRRPAGAVLADICRDLGILPSDLPPDLAEALRTTVLRYGGSLVVLVLKELGDDLRRRVAAEIDRLKRARTDAPSAPAAAPSCPTGPPPLARAA